MNYLLIKKVTTLNLKSTKQPKLNHHRRYRVLSVSAGRNEYGNNISDMTGFSGFSSGMKPFPIVSISYK